VERISRNGVFALGNGKKPEAKATQFDHKKCSGKKM